MADRSIIRFARPDSERDAPLILARDRREDESDESWAFQSERQERFGSIVVVARIVRRDVLNDLALEQERLQAEMDALGNDWSVLKHEKKFRDFYRGAFDQLIVGIKNAAFQDIVSGDIVESETFTGSELFMCLSQSGLLLDAVMAALRANRLTEDEKKA